MRWRKPPLRARQHWVVTEAEIRGSGIDLEMEDELDGGEDERNKSSKWTLTEKRKRRNDWSQTSGTES